MLSVEHAAANVNSSVSNTAAWPPHTQLAPEAAAGGRGRAVHLASANPRRGLTACQTPRRRPRQSPRCSAGVREVNLRGSLASEANADVHIALAVALATNRTVTSLTVTSTEIGLGTVVSEVLKVSTTLKNVVIGCGRTSAAHPEAFAFALENGRRFLERASGCGQLWH